MTPILPRVPLAEVPPLGPEPPSDAQRFAQWLRCGLAPAAFRRGWRQRLGIAFVLAGVVLLLGFGGQLSEWQQVVLWSGLGIFAAILTRGLWLGLFGPVLFFDLVRMARKGRTFLLRGGYLVAVLAALLFVYSSRPGGDLFGEMRLDQHKLTEFAERFFFVFLAVQFGTIFLLTPIFTATAIAEEKERKTLDDMLTTDLRGREIVLGKLASRLLAMLLLLASGLPVLSFVQFLGGVDPNLVLAGFVASVVTMLSLGSLGILNSVYARRPRGAIASTYVIAGAYLVLTSCLAPTVSRSGPNLLGWIASGNIIVAYAQVGTSANSASGTTGAEVFSVLGPYVVFHAAVLVVLTAVATLKLRTWNGEEQPTLAHPVAAVRTQSQLRRLLPAIGKNVILWKELYAESNYQPHPLVHAVLVLAGGLFLMVAGLAYLFVLGMSVVEHQRSDGINLWVQVVGTPIACLMLLAIAVRAARCLVAEREQQTLDSLLTTPLSRREILWGKWLGALLSVRWGWCFLGTVWLLGLLGGGLHPLSLFLLVAAWWIFAAYAASLGLSLSMRCRTTLRATVWTLISSVLFGPVLALSIGSGYLFAEHKGHLSWSPELADFAIFTPPGAMVYLTFGWGNGYLLGPEDGLLSRKLIVACLTLFAHGINAWWFWLDLRMNFGAVMRKR